MVKRLMLVLVLIFVAGRGQDLPRAQMLEGAGQLESAFLLYKVVLEQNPDNRQAVQGFIRTARGLGRFDSLFQVLQRYEKQTEGNGDIVLGVIEALFGLRRRGAALNRVRVFYQQWPTRLLELVELLRRYGENGVAAELLEGAIASQGLRIHYAERLIEIYEQEGNVSRPARLVAEIVNADPNQLARLLPRLADYGRKSKGRVAKELERIRDSKLRARAMAEVYVGAGDDETAVRLVRAVMSGAELLLLARKWEETGAWGAALRLYQDYGAGADRSRVLRRMGRMDEALLVLEKDSTPEARLELAEFFREEKQELERAVQLYHDVLRRRPGHYGALLGLAGALVGLKELDSARAVLMKIGEPRDSVLFLLARVLFYQGKFDSVQIVVRNLNGRFPQSPLVNDALELALLSLGGEGVTTLAQAMLDYESGDEQEGMSRLRRLMPGQDRIAQEAFFLFSRFLYQQRRYREALAVLDTFAIRFPNSELGAKAGLVRAEIYQDGFKDENRVQSILEGLIVQFPGSPYVELARNWLKRLKGEIAPGEVR